VLMVIASSAEAGDLGPSGTKTAAMVANHLHAALNGAVLGLVTVAAGLLSLWLLFLSYG